MLLTSINFKYDVVGAKAPFFASLDETHKQRIRQRERTRQMLGCTFAPFLASQWGVFFNEAYVVYICEL